MTETTIGLVFFALAVGIFTGIPIGLIYERIQWNKLIQSGVLPKPQKVK